MLNYKVLCLGNEFIQKDSFAKRLFKKLKKENPNFQFINIKDTFQLIDYLKSNEELIILDTVENLNETKEIQIKELSKNKIISLHDLDAQFFLELLGNKSKIKIIGIPEKGNKGETTKKIKRILKSFPLHFQKMC